MTKVGVVLAGCGVFDGSEIHEAVCTLLCLQQAGAEYQCLAPNMPQMHVFDHLRMQPVPGESRNVLVEAARIARGNIVALDQVNVADYDAFAFPGGYGAAKNLCTYAVDGADCRVQPQVERVIREARAAGKPLGFWCIAPVIAAKVLGTDGPRLTVGADADAAAAMLEVGAQVQDCGVTGCIVDSEQKIVSTGAYNSTELISDVYTGIQHGVKELLKLVG